MPLQNDNKASKIMFLTTQKSQKKPKTKENCNSEILQISLPQIILLQKDTQALKIIFAATQNKKAKNSRKSKKHLKQFVRIIY